MLKSTLHPLRPLLRSTSCCRMKSGSSDSPNKEDEKQKELDRIAREASIDEPPTTCCMSGCSNCVYIAWAEALSAKMKHADPVIAEKILKMVDDPNLRAFLDMELKIRGLKK